MEQIFYEKCLTYNLIYVIILMESLWKQVKRKKEKF